MNLTTDTLTPGDVIMHPERNTTMWRALEIDHDGNKIRAVRSTKSGEIHGLVRKTEGTWIPMANLEGFTVIGHFVETAKGTGARAQAHAAAAASAAAPQTPATEGLSGTIAAPSLNSDGKVLKFVENTLRAMADGIRELQAV